MDNNLRKRLQSALEHAPNGQETLLDLKRATAFDPDRFLDLLRDDDRDPKLRSKAIWAAGWAECVEWISDLENVALSSRDSVVIWEAAKVIAMLDPDSTVFRKMVLDQPERDRRLAGLHCVGMVNDASMIGTLEALLCDRSEHSEIRGHAAEALGSIGAPESQATLLRMLDDAEPSVRFWSVFALRTVGDEGAVPALQRVTVSDSGAVGGFGSIADEAKAALAEIKLRRSR